MEVDDPKTTDISSLKEAAKEIVEKSESELVSKNGDKVNGVVMNGDNNGSNGNGDSHDDDIDDAEEEVEAPSAESENGDTKQDEDEDDVKDEDDDEVEAINTTPKKSPKTVDLDVSPM